jgi:hypothetical protein
MVKIKLIFIGVLSAITLFTTTGHAQETPPNPYFVTYDHYMEELDALEIRSDSVLGKEHGINTFLGNLTEFEYGARRWWTTELYLDWQHTRHEGSVFTGFRFENRFRPFLEEHRINPVFYAEYEHLNGADKTLKEIVGFDGKENLAVSNSVSRHESEHELETKLILSSEIGLWNVAGNFIGVKNFNGDPWEFGYAFGFSRPLAARAGKRCAFCASSFIPGVEAYGGLGTSKNFTTTGTSQYIAPVLVWALPSETNIHISTGWGLTELSVGTLVRFGVSQEIDDIGRRIGSLFRKH